MTKTIAERVIHLIAEQMGVEIEDVKPETNFADDFSIDSLDSVELVMAVEEEFDIEIHDGDVDELKTVDQAIKYVEKRVGA